MIAMEVAMRSIIAIILILFASAAAAQECKDWHTTLELMATYGESPFLRVTEYNGRHLRLFGNPDTGTWTIVRMTQDCWTIVDHGYGMEPIWSERQPGESL